MAALINGIGVGVPFSSFTGAGADPSAESLLFDGVDESGTSTIPSVFPSATNFTMSFWVHPTTSSTKKFYGHKQTNSDAVGIQTNADDIIINCANGVNRNCQTTGDDVPANQWSHVVWIYDGGGATNSDKCKVYVNGSSVSLTFSGTWPTSLSSSTPTSYYGQSDLNTFHYLGYMDEMAFYDYSFDTDDVAENYNDGATFDQTTMSSGAPEHYYRFETALGDDETTVQDFGDTGGNDITLENIELSDYSSSEIP